MPKTSTSETKPDSGLEPDSGTEIPRELLLYLHTHWDREWYWSFGAYRTQLIQVVLSIIEKLESGELANFMLDGQTCLLEDLEEMVPGLNLSARITALVQHNKLSIGPWYVLADQLLVGGESLVRNLDFGIKASNAVGRAAMVGYCPDTFGHSADLPRILKGFGIDNAVVWRGVPPLTNGPLFLWQSADGSEVLAHQLARGYYQTAFHEDVSSKQLTDYLLSFVADETLTYSPEMRAALVPVGGDHLRPPSNYKTQLQGALSSSEKKLTATTVSLEQFFEKAKRDFAADLSPLQLVQGELRDNAAAFACERAYMLAGVLSTRLYLKRENRLLEHALLKKIEPLRAMTALAGIIEYPQYELDFSWKLLLKNHPHDSICGCSIDEVHDEMQARSKSLNGQLAVLYRQAQEALVRTLAPDLKTARLGLNAMTVMDPAEKPNTLVTVNTSGNKVSMPVAVRLALLDDEHYSGEIAVPDGLQVVHKEKATEAFLELSGVPLFKNIELIDAFVYAENMAPFSITHLKTASSIFDGKSKAACKIKDYSNGFDGLALCNQFFTVYIDKKGQLLVKESRVEAESEADAKPEAKAETKPEATLHKLGHRLIDTGDGGDTYNYDPIALDKPVEAKVVSVSSGLAGPLVASIFVEYEIDLPQGLKQDKNPGQQRRKGEAESTPALINLKRSNKTIKHKIVTEITLKANVPIVYFDTRWKNKASDHRLEIVFSTPQKLTKTFSENHYSVIERAVARKVDLNPVYSTEAFVPLGHEGTLNRYPCQRFFVAHDYCFLNSGLPEYGAAGSDVSITLLRAVSYLSRNRLRTRGGGAGPNIATPGANSIGKNHVSYGWAPLQQDHHSGGNFAEAYSLAEIYEEPLTAFLVPAAAKTETMPKTTMLGKSFFALDNDAIKIMASFIDEAGKMTLRLLNVSGWEQSAKLEGAERISLHQLDGSPASETNASLTLIFKPWQLLTVKIMEPARKS